MKPPLIYLANLTHVREGRASTESIPLNLGYLAAYLKKYYSGELRIRLFNLPQKLEEALQQETPDILASSAYIWSFRLNYFYLEKMKRINPKIVTVMGGPNYPGQRNYQESFMREFHGVDFFCQLEGEKTFLNLVQKLADSSFNLEKVKEQPVPGFHFLRGGELITSEPGERIRDVDAVPSPYLTGILDEFLEGGFVPMLQSNRGCPFTCTFCESGNDYHNKISSFSLERVLAEIDYIAERVKSKSLHITDDNFGIFARDREISKKLAECKKEKDWPLMVNVSTSKVNKKQVAECIAILGESIFFSASMQSFNEDTLREIRRKNLSFPEFQEIIGDLQKNYKVPSLCEVILGMPEESVSTHLDGIEQAVNAGIDFVTPYTCMLLWNTGLKEDPYYDKFKMVRKFRVIPRDFGKYLNEKVIEIEEVCVGTTTLTLEEYLYMREFHFVLSNFYNLRAFREFVAYLRVSGASIFEWLKKIHARLQQNKTESGKIFEQFSRDTEEELWHSEKELIKHYQKEENFNQLFAGTAGANLLIKYQAVCLDHLAIFGESALSVALETFNFLDPVIATDIMRYCVAVRGSAFNPSEDEKLLSFSFDALGWIRSGMPSDVRTYLRPADFIFSASEKGKKLLREYLEFYGTNPDSRGKILTRIAPEMLFNSCRYKNENCFEAATLKNS